MGLAEHGAETTLCDTDNRNERNDSLKDVTDCPPTWYLDQGTEEFSSSSGLRCTKSVDDKSATAMTKDDNLFRLQFLLVAPPIGATTHYRENATPTR